MAKENMETERAGDKSKVMRLERSGHFWASAHGPE